MPRRTRSRVSAREASCSASTWRWLPTHTAPSAVASPLATVPTTAASMSRSPSRLAALARTTPAENLARTASGSGVCSLGARSTLFTTSTAGTRRCCSASTVSKMACPRVDRVRVRREREGSCGAAGGGRGAVTPCPGCSLGALASDQSNSRPRRCDDCRAKAAATTSHCIVRYAPCSSDPCVEPKSFQCGLIPPAQAPPRCAPNLAERRGERRLSFSRGRGLPTSSRV